MSPIEERDVYETAVHELGHAVVALRYCDEVTIAITPNATYAGDTLSESSVSGLMTCAMPGDQLAHAAILWGGPLAEIWQSLPETSLDEILTQFAAGTLDPGERDFEILRGFSLEVSRQGAELAMNVLAEHADESAALAGSLLEEYRQTGTAGLRLARPT